MIGKSISHYGILEKLHGGGVVHTAADTGLTEFSAGRTGIPLEIRGESACDSADFRQQIPTPSCIAGRRAR